MIYALKSRQRRFREMRLNQFLAHALRTRRNRTYGHVRFSIIHTLVQSHYLLVYYKHTLGEYRIRLTFRASKTWCHNGAKQISVITYLNKKAGRV